MKTQNLKHLKTETRYRGLGLIEDDNHDDDDEDDDDGEDFFTIRGNDAEL